ncbi:hypothetical protein ABTX80_24890 [Streptomyces erythrochromogenes]|uniref:hypothetical protein n=1 Tax=Streptomyces erythrochromogenes TaxID=285574 RepID=UPI00332A1EFE
MLTLLLVAGGLTVIALAAVAFSWALRRGEEQDRRTRRIDPHTGQAARPAASWGQPTPDSPTTPDKPADSRTRPRHRRPS